MIASLFGASAAGWFGLALAIGGIPASQVGSAVGDVFAMELAAAVRAGDRMRARSLFYKALRSLAAFGLAPIIALAVLSPMLAPIILGHSWSEVGWIVAAISPWLYIELVVSPITAVLFVLQVQEYKVIYDVLSVVTIAAAYAAARVLGWSIIYLVLAMAAARIVSYLVHLAVIVFVVQRRLVPQVAARC
jgi:O-antigen/teichoic acid export membrane protein